MIDQHYTDPKLAALYDGDKRMTFDLFYHFGDDVLASRSELRFLSCADIRARIEKAGLKVNLVQGDYRGLPFDEKTTQEMVFFASHG